MIRFFSKKLPHKELIDTHVSFVRKDWWVRENKTMNVAGDQYSFIAAPYTSEVFSLAYLQSVLFTDIIAKRSKQEGNTTNVYFSAQAFWSTQTDNQSLLSQEKEKKKMDGYTMMDCLGCSFNQTSNEIAFTEHVNNSIADFIERGYLRYSLGVRYWSIDGQTVVSDSQLNQKTVVGKKYFIKFFIDSKKHTVTATLQDPLLLFSAAAIAVSPFDKRYKKFVGKNVIVPIVNRKIPLIVDSRIDMAKDTWAVILCPAHNREHFAIAKDNWLSCDIYAVDKNWYFTDYAWEFAQKNAYDFRDNIVQYLTDISNLDRIEEAEYTHYEDKYNKEHTLLPLATQQWFFSHVNQHLTDTLRAFVGDAEDESLLQEYFADDTICVSRYLQWSRRFPVLTKNDNFVGTMTSSDFVSLYETSLSPKKLVASHIALFAMQEWSLSDVFHLEDYVLHLHEFDNVVGDYRINLYEKVLGNIYAWKDTLLKQLQEFADTVRQAIENPLLFDQIGFDLENSFLVSSHEEGLCLDWSATNFDAWTTLSPHTIDTNFLAALDYVANAASQQSKNTVVAFPHTQLSWSKFILSPEMYRSENTQTHCFVKNKSLLLTKNFVAKWIDKWWTDSVRVCVLQWNISYDAEIEQWNAELYDRFIGKFWNASRYIFKSLLVNQEVKYDLDYLEKELWRGAEEFNDFDLWILLKLHHTIEEVRYHFQRKELSHGLSLLLHSIWYDFCDCYLEVVKKQQSGMTKNVLAYCVGVYLQLLYAYFPIASYWLWSLLGFSQTISSSLQQGVVGLEKNYKFSMLMDIVAKWNKLHLQNRSQHLYDDLVLCIQSNRDFLEYTKNYEDFICTMVGANEIMYVSEQEQLSDDWHTDTVVNIVLWARYRKKIHQKQELTTLKTSLLNKQQLLQNIRSIIVSVDSHSKEYQDYLQQIEDLKISIEDIEYDISKIRYWL